MNFYDKGPAPVRRHYGGAVYDSSLELDWAKFFDALCEPFTPHPVEPLASYTPDFFLPKRGLFLEIKPRAMLADRDEVQALEAKIITRFLRPLEASGRRPVIATLYGARSASNNPFDGVVVRRVSVASVGDPIDDIDACIKAYDVFRRAEELPWMLLSDLACDWSVLWDKAHPKARLRRQKRSAILNRGVR